MIDIKKQKYRIKQDLFDDRTFMEGRPKRLFKEGEIVEGVPVTYEDKDYVNSGGIYIPINYVEEL